MKEKSVSFRVDTKIYPKEVVYKACYVFIDRMYILLDMPAKKDAISVTLKGKTTLTRKGIEKLEGEFMNELLNSLVRENVSKCNRKVLEQIVGGAMGAALGIREMEDGDRSGSHDRLPGIGGVDDAEAKEIEAAVEALKRELAAIEAGGDYEADLLGIRTIVSDELCREADGSCGNAEGILEIGAAEKSVRMELAEVEVSEATGGSTSGKKSAKRIVKKPAKEIVVKKTATVKSMNKKNSHGKGNKR